MPYNEQSQMEKSNQQDVLEEADYSCGHGAEGKRDPYDELHVLCLRPTQGC